MDVKGSESDIEFIRQRNNLQVHLNANTDLHTSNIHMKETNTIWRIYETYTIWVVIKEVECLRFERYIHRSTSLIPNVSTDNRKYFPLAVIAPTNQFPPFIHHDKTVKK